VSWQENAQEFIEENAAALATLAAVVVVSAVIIGKKIADCVKEQPQPPPPPPPVGSTRAELDDMARRLNRSIHEDGSEESRNVQAVVLTADGKYVVFTQREYNAFDDEIVALEKRYNVTIDERVIGDNPREDEGIHAEMLAVSWMLQNEIQGFNMIGVSRPPCARCAAVLDSLGIDHRVSDNAMTQNWVHPHRHADLPPPNGAMGNLPQKVTKNREYGW
jgi:hypothetical protein